MKKITQILIFVLLNLAVSGLIFARNEPVFAAATYIQPINWWVSSQLDNSTWPVNNLFDGNPATQWSSVQLSGPDISANPQWVSVDFGSPVRLAKIVLVPRVWGGKIQAFPSSLNFAYSDDGKTWKNEPGSVFESYPAPSLNSSGGAPELSFSINDTHRYFAFGASAATTDSYGTYYVQLADIKFESSECQSSNECAAGLSCQQGVCGVNTVPYWNLNPGNYWIMKGTDSYGGSPLSFRERYDLELPDRVCSATKPTNVLNWRMTRDVDCAAPHQCYWGNLRFMFADPSKDSQPYIWAFGDKRYNRDPNNPYTSTGSLYARNYYGTVIPATGTYVPPYPYTPKFLSGFGEQSEYRYTQSYCGYNAGGTNPVPEGDLCTEQCVWDGRADLIMRYQNLNLSTPAYNGPAVLVSQGEHGGWCTREDWYLAPNIGIARVDQWSCTDNPAQSAAANYCGSWTDNGTNAPNCYRNLALSNPPMSMSLEKYYLGGPLKVLANGAATLTARPGDTLNLTVTDPATGFTFEGHLESDNSSVNSQLAAYWFPQNGTGSVKLPVTPGTYNLRFREHIFGPAAESLAAGSETVTGANGLPWSNTVTVNVAAPTAIPVPSNTPVPVKIQGDLNNDNHVNIFDYNILVTNFGKTGTAGFTPSDINRDGVVNIFDYNILVGNFGR